MHPKVKNRTTSRKKTVVNVIVATTMLVVDLEAPGGKPVDDAADIVVGMTKVSSREYAACSSPQCSSLSADRLDAPLHRYIRAPSPPSLPNFRSSSLGYMQIYPNREDLDVRNTTQHEVLDRHGRPTVLTRRRRSRSREMDEPGRRPLARRPGDEVVETRHHRRMPTEDYDWYDKDGMKVRVREI